MIQAHLQTINNMINEINAQKNEFRSKIQELDQSQKANLKVVAELNESRAELRFINQELEQTK